MTRPATPSAPSPNSGRQQAPRGKPSFWHYGLYFVVTVASLGTLAWVPIADAATRLRRGWLFGLALAYALAGTTEAILYFAAVGSGLAGSLMVLLVVSGLVVQVLLVRELQRSDTGGSQPSAPRSSGR